MHAYGMPLDMRIINNVQHRNRQHIKNVTITLASKRAVGGMVMMVGMVGDWSSGIWT